MGVFSRAATGLGGGTPDRAPGVPVLRTAGLGRATGVLVPGRHGDAVVAGLNQLRAGAGCAAVRLRASLRRAAQGHSSDMAAHRHLTHTGTDGSAPQDRMRTSWLPPRRHRRGHRGRPGQRGRGRRRVDGRPAAPRHPPHLPLHRRRRGPDGQPRRRLVDPGPGLARLTPTVGRATAVRRSGVAHAVQADGATARPAPPPAAGARRGPFP
ncbi:CAP domain-containing protein [Streptomyces lasalocidi]